jgi:hypothetical protein
VGGRIEIHPGPIVSPPEDFITLQNNRADRHFVQFGSVSGFLNRQRHRIFVDVVQIGARLMNVAVKSGIYRTVEYSSLPKMRQ